MSIDFKVIKEQVLPFAAKVRARLTELGKFNKIVRIQCPNPEHIGAEPIVYVRAGLFGYKRHLHMACENKHCPYRLME